MNPMMSDGWARRVLVFATFLCVVGCGPQHAASAAPPSPSAATSSEEVSVQAHNLTIYGYNYTDTEIGSFEVNGQGGGNVQLSTPDDGGGSGVCCVRVFTPYRETRPITIKWSRDGDTWCEQEVTLKPPLPEDAKAFEVHFYRDGRIEVAVTGDLRTRMSSPPRVRLAAFSRATRNKDESKNINNDAKFARCKLGYR
jgi:hypothetical protein